MTSGALLSVRPLFDVIDRKVLPSDYSTIEDLSKAVIKEKQKFVRLELPKEVLLEMFKVQLTAMMSSYMLIAFQYNKYKQHFIETKVPDGTSTTVYRCGPMIDLCIGPHVPHTGRIKAFMVTKVYSRRPSIALDDSDFPSTLLHTGSEMRKMILFNGYMVYPSPIQSS